MLSNKGKIYPQAIKGKYRSRKNIISVSLLLLYYLASWIRWNRGTESPDQALFIDTIAGKGYLFGLEIWSDEIYYITALLIISAIGLFFFTTLYGRVWCGFSCPHTIYVDIFVKIEEFFQGNRNERIKIEHNSNHNKSLQIALTHLSWLLVSFSFAFAWVCYFYDSFKLTSDLLSNNVTNTATYWLIGLTVSTYLIAGYARQRICLYMCPYGRFQSAMLDNNTTIVTYNDWRGEPRGFSKDQNNYGDCVNCNKCVVVCPMGIDIRDGLQMDCIGCGLCIDACNSVMSKLDKEQGLISYESNNSYNAKKEGKEYITTIFNPKTILFSIVVIAVIMTIGINISNKTSFTINIQRDRGPIYTILPDGSVRNTYILDLYNKTNATQQYNISVDNNDSLLLKDQYSSNIYSKQLRIEIKKQTAYKSKIFIKDPLADKTKKQKLFLNIKDSQNKISTKSLYFLYK